MNQTEDLTDTNNNTVQSEENWTCQTCTLINNPINNECIACGTSKNGNTENSTAVWTCNYCTTFNNVSTDVCMSCGLPMNQNSIDEDQYVQSELEGMFMNYFRSLNQSRLATYPEDLTNEEKAEWLAFRGSSCRCTPCKISAIRNIFQLNQTATTDEQKEIAGIMMTQILPSLINSSFNSSDQILQLIAAGNNSALEDVMNRSLAEYEGDMIPANKEEIDNLKDIQISERCLDNYHNQTTCVVCMEEFNLKDTLCCITEMPCGHIFHKSCLTTWLKESDASCPICKHRINKRLDLIKKDDEEQYQEDEDSDLVDDNSYFEDQEDEDPDLVDDNSYFEDQEDVVKDQENVVKDQEDEYSDLPDLVDDNSYFEDQEDFHEEIIDVVDLFENP